ncbi:MAG: hypothetical protein ABIO92_01705, partial [Chloroflexia bacterium]
AAVHGWTGRVLRSMPISTPDKPPPTYGDLRRFFFPLAGTAIMNTMMQPVVTAGIASAAVAWLSPTGSVVAVASYAIAWSMAFLVFGPTLSMTQASIAWSGSADPEVREKGPRVLIGVGFGLALLMAVATFSPFSHWLFITIIQAPPLTAASAVEVAHWLVPMPILHTFSFMLRGRLIAMGNPKAIRLAQLVDLIAIFVVIQLATNGPFVSLLQGAPAAPLAAIAYNFMLLVDIIILTVILRSSGRADR